MVLVGGGDVLSEVVLAAVGTVAGVAPEPPVGTMGLQVALQVPGGRELDPAERAGGLERRAEDARGRAPGGGGHRLVGVPAGARHFPGLALHAAQAHRRAALGHVVREAGRVGRGQVGGVGGVAQGRQMRGVRRRGVRRHAGLAVHGGVRGLAGVRRVDGVGLGLVQVGGGGRVVDRGAVGEGAPLRVAEGRQRPRRAVGGQGRRRGIGGVGAVRGRAPAGVRERGRGRRRVVGDVLPGVDLLRRLLAGRVRLRGVVVGGVDCRRRRGWEVTVWRPLTAAVAVPLWGRGLGGRVVVELLDVRGDELGAVAGGGRQLDLAVHGRHAAVVACKEEPLLMVNYYNYYMFSLQ